MKNACIQTINLFLALLLSGQGQGCAQAAWMPLEPTVSEPFAWNVSATPNFAQAAAPTLTPTPNPAATFIPSSTVEIPELSLAQLAVPFSLMAYGMVETAMTHNFKLLNYAAHNAVDIYKPRKIRIDDYTQFLPMASVYALNAFGIKGKHNFADRTIILGMASIFMAASVNAIKYTVREQRPDASTRNSFPSGHTATAFMGAEFLWQEYKDVSPWYGVCGYAVAAATGALRVHNNRHWVGDVLFGAGLGMLSTKAAYYLYPRIKQKILQNKEKKKSSSNVTYLFAPYYNGVQGGLSTALYF